MNLAETLYTDQTPTTVCLQFVPIRVRSGRLEVQVCPGAEGWTLPAGAPDTTEGLDEAAERMGNDLLALPGTSLQLGAFGTAADGLNVAFMYLVRPPGLGEPPPPGLVAGASWWEVRGIRASAETEPVISRMLARLEFEVEYGMAGFHLVGEEFTVSELRSVHEAVRGISMDPSNFRKRVTRWVDEGLVDELPRRRPTATRPARLYSLVR